MSDAGPSRTAQSVAMARALEGSRPDRLFQDPYAARLLYGPAARAAARACRLPPVRWALEALYAARFPGVLAGLVLRTRFLDEAFVAGLAAAGQAAILGVGLDSRAWRIHAHPSVPVFELDREPELAWRASRLARAVPPRRIVAAPIDFEHESLGEALRRAGLLEDRPTAYLWEGVAQYLSDEAVDATLATVGASAPGSTLAFTYVTPDGLRSRSAAGAARSGEPWRSAIEPEELPARLGRHGLALHEDVGSAELAERYLAPLGRTASPGASRTAPVWTVERCAIARVRDERTPPVRRERQARFRGPSGAADGSA